MSLPNCVASEIDPVDRTNAFSSTDFADAPLLAARMVLMHAPVSVAGHAELGFAPRVWRGSRAARPVNGEIERKESMHQRFGEAAKSNRKETQIETSRALLKGANTSGIRLFADPQRQSSVGAVEQVMDRSAEGAARGSDAV